MHYTESDIKGISRIKRLNLLNSVTGIKPANLVGTVSEDNKTNLAIISSVVHLGSNPAMIGFILRPQKDRKTDTYRNINDNGYFTINNIHSELIEKAHYTSVKFSEEESEFQTLDIKEEFLDSFPAPFVKESKIKIGLKTEDMMILPNNCIFVVGSVKHLIIPEEVIDENGSLNFQNFDGVGISGLDSYYALKQIAKFPYARKENIPEHLTDFKV